ncbi:MAG: cob(I)yrinic acid a,c-diamide adenosyltransferase [Phycisphaerae bacterium]
MKLYTAQGDDGTTRLFNGARVGKDDLRVDGYGTIDELNAYLGIAASLTRSNMDNACYNLLHGRIVFVQAELFSIGSELATPAGVNPPEAVTPEHTARLESWIDEAAASAAPLNSFILPGGDPLAASLHVCRTVCRRAERRVVALSHSVEINPYLLIYLNRLSDLFFAWARQVNHETGINDVPWQPPTA